MGSDLGDIGNGTLVKSTDGEVSPWRHRRFKVQKSLRYSAQTAKEIDMPMGWERTLRVTEVATDIPISEARASVRNHAILSTSHRKASPPWRIASTV